MSRPSATSTSSSTISRSPPSSTAHGQPAAALLLARAAERHRLARGLVNLLRREQHGRLGVYQPGRADRHVHSRHRHLVRKVEDPHNIVFSEGKVVGLEPSTK